MYKIFPKFLFACATFVCTLTHGCSAAGMAQKPIHLIVQGANLTGARSSLVNIAGIAMKVACCVAVLDVLTLADMHMHLNFGAPSYGEALARGIQEGIHAMEEAVTHPKAFIVTVACAVALPLRWLVFRVQMATDTRD
ncbi:MAG: hypothetical protein LBF84_04210 [Holosporales bacterium]|nr:hypothetical protein [Holosporales bacterium]